LYFDANIYDIASLADKHGNKTVDNRSSDRVIVDKDAWDGGRFNDVVEEELDKLSEGGGSNALKDGAITEDFDFDFTGVVLERFVNFIDCDFLVINVFAEDEDFVDFTFFEVFEGFSEDDDEDDVSPSLIRLRVNTIFE
jgi:hypothetical protein